MEGMRQRRYLAALLGAVLATATVAAACRPGGHGRPPGTGGPGTSVPTSGTTGTTPDTVPPWRTTTTTMPPPVNCGSVARGGTPTTAYNGPAVSCFRDAWEAGTPATVRIPGAETQVLEVVGVHRLVATSASAGRQLCTGLAIGGNDLHPTDCGPVPPPRTETGALDCGVMYYATGWPTTPPLRLPPCFLDAWAGGVPARLITRDQTDGQGGAIRIVMYEILGPGRLRVTTDPTDTVDPGPVTVGECTGLEHDVSRLHPTGCTPV